MPFFLAAGLLLLAWLLNRFVESLLRRELEGWMSERVPLHEHADILEPVSLQPVSEAIHEELGTGLLLIRISRNNDCVASIISGISLVASAWLLSDTSEFSLLPVIGTVVTFVFGGAVYRLPLKIYSLLCFRGLSMPTVVWALLNVVVGLLLASGIWSSQ